jgi:beta-mannanase
MLRGRAYIVIFAVLVFCAGILAHPLTTRAAPRFEVNIFYPGSAYDTSLITNFESTLGVNFTAAKWYQDWATAFDPAVANRYNAAGLIPELTWEPQENGQGVAYDNVVAGAYDSYIAATANAIKDLGFVIRISLAPEMNTDWTPWGIGKQGNNRDNHKVFWQHVVQKFRDAGATNVKWVWSANVRPWNAQALYGSYADIFPGADYVDYMGLDGYNWGTSQSWSAWQTFDEIFQSSYNELAAVSGRDILIMEMASTEIGGDKAAWIANTFDRLNSAYARIKGFTWFNINKETDWRINSSAAAQAAFSAAYSGQAVASGGAGTNSNSTSPTPGSGTTANSSPAKPKAATNQSSSNAANAPDGESKLEEVTNPVKKLAGSLLGADTLTSNQSPNWSIIAGVLTFLSGAGLLTFFFRHRLLSFHAQPGFIALFNGFGHVDTIHHHRKFRHLHARHKARLAKT